MFSEFRTCHVPRLSPFSLIAKIYASSPESLCVQKMPGWHFEAAIPLLSIMSFESILPVIRGWPKLDLGPADAFWPSLGSTAEHPAKAKGSKPVSMTKAENLAIVFIDIHTIPKQYKR